MGVLVDFATEHLVGCVISGTAPHACVILPFGEIDKPGHLFPANEFGKLDLKLTGESGAGAIRVVYQQLRK